MKKGCNGLNQKRSLLVDLIECELGLFQQLVVVLVQMVIQ